MLERPSGTWPSLFQAGRFPSELLEKAGTAVIDLPSTLVVRAGDALHLACAEEHGFEQVYTNDRHVLQAARHFHLTGVNVLGEKG